LTTAPKESLDASQRRDLPPDGKSSSDLEEHSERRPMFATVDSPRPTSSSRQPSITMTSLQPTGAYYLAQRQLQLMKKIGEKASLQVYEPSCLQLPNLKEQEDLLFGDTLKRERMEGDGRRSVNL